MVRVIDRAWRVALDGSASPHSWYVLSQLFVYNLSHDVVDTMSQSLVYGMSQDPAYNSGRCESRQLGAFDNGQCPDPLLPPSAVIHNGSSPNVWCTEFSA